MIEDQLATADYDSFAGSADPLIQGMDGEALREIFEFLKRRNGQRYWKEALAWVERRLSRSE